MIQVRPHAHTHANFLITQHANTELPLTLFPIRITFVLGRKRPRLRRPPKEHFRDPHPILAVGARKERFCVPASVQLSVSTQRVHLVRSTCTTYRVHLGPGKLAHAR